MLRPQLEYTLAEKRLWPGQSKLYPQQYPEYPFDFKLNSMDVNSLILCKYLSSEVILNKLQYPFKNKPSPFGLYALSTLKRGLRLIGFLLNNWNPNQSG